MKRVLITNGAGFIGSHVADELPAKGHDVKVLDYKGTREHPRTVLNDPGAARELAERGRATVLARHGCSHRVVDLLDIDAQIAPARHAACAKQHHDIAKTAA